MVGSVNNAAVRWHYSASKGAWAGYHFRSFLCSNLNFILHHPCIPDPLSGWPLSMLEKLGISDLAGKLPRDLLQLGAPVGGLTAEAANHLRLPTGLLVAQVRSGTDYHSAESGTPSARVSIVPPSPPQGGADAFIGMLGLGVVRPGQMALLTGSSHLQLGLVTGGIHGPGIFGSYEVRGGGGSKDPGSLVRTRCEAHVRVLGLGKDGGLRRLLASIRRTPSSLASTSLRAGRPPLDPSSIGSSGTWCRLVLGTKTSMQRQGLWHREQRD